LVAHKPGGHPTPRAVGAPAPTGHKRMVVLCRGRRPRRPTQRPLCAKGATRDPCAGGTWIAKAGSDLQSRPGPEAVAAEGGDWGIAELAIPPSKIKDFCHLPRQREVLRSKISPFPRRGDHWSPTNPEDIPPRGPSRRRPLQGINVWLSFVGGGALDAPQKSLPCARGGFSSLKLSGTARLMCGFLYTIRHPPGPFRTGGVPYICSVVVTENQKLALGVFLPHGAGVAGDGFDLAVFRFQMDPAVLGAAYAGELHGFPHLLDQSDPIINPEKKMSTKNRPPKPAGERGYQVFAKSSICVRIS